MLLSLLPWESHARAPSTSVSLLPISSQTLLWPVVLIPTFYFRVNDNFSSLLFVPLVHTEGNYSLLTDVFLLDQVNPALAVPSQRVFLFLGTLSVLSFCVQRCLGTVCSISYEVALMLCPGLFVFPSLLEMDNLM